MPRTSGICYYKSRKGYYTQVDRKIRLLAKGADDKPRGPTYLKALREFGNIMAMNDADTAKDANSVRLLLEKYMTFLTAERKASTCRMRDKVFKLFVQAFGDKPIGHLSKTDIRSWVGAQSGWGNGMRRIAYAGLSAAFNWAIDEGLCTVNPVSKIKRPGVRSRGREALLGKDAAEAKANIARIMAAARPYLRRMLVCLENTGARPSELIAASADAFDPIAGTLNYYAESKRQDGEHSHKVAHRKDRTIIFTGAALKIMCDLVKKHPTGLLFRRPCGKGFNTLVSMIKRLRDKVGGLPTFTAYSFRHEFATRWLQRGGSVEILATLLGNTPGTIYFHYSHLISDIKNLKAKLAEFRDNGESDQAAAV